MESLMRRTSIRLLALLGMALALPLAGCISKERVYQEIMQNRMNAYHSWKRAKEGEESATTQVLAGDLSMASALLIAVGNDERLGHNKELLAQLTDRDAAAGRVVESYSGALPKLNLEASYRRLDKVSSFDTGLGTVTSGARSNYQVDTILTQPIFRGGAISAGIRGAKIFSYLTDEQISQTLQGVIYDVCFNYYDVLLNQSLVEVSLGDLELSQKHLDDVEKKKAAGVVSQYDVLRAQVDVSNVEATLIARQNAVHVAMTTLLRTLGVSQESQVVLSDKLEYAKLTPDLESAVYTAFLQRPEIRQAELTVRINREALIEAWAGYLPRLDASFTNSYAKPDPHNSNINEWGDAWSTALVLSWPLFDGLATTGRVQQAKAALNRSAIELAGAEEQVLLDVKQAIFKVEDAEKLVKSQENNLERASEALRLATAGYEAGVNTELEMLDTRQALSQTRSLYYQAVYQHEIAALGLLQAQGVLSYEALGD